MWRHHPQKNQFSVASWQIFFSGICDRIFRFQKTVWPFDDFSPKKITVCNVHSDKGGGAFYINFEKLCPSLYIYTCQSTLSTTRKK
jgi:hypothetical protein